MYPAERGLRVGEQFQHLLERAGHVLPGERVMDHQVAVAVKALHGSAIDRREPIDAVLRHCLEPVQVGGVVERGLISR